MLALAGRGASIPRTVFNPDIDAMTTLALRLAVEDFDRPGRQRGKGPGLLAGHSAISKGGRITLGSTSAAYGATSVTPVIPRASGGHP
ncbi:hypothetical protein ACFXP3_16405 [Streptomyces sp. NPDC059096]|uniref:hypothetical protein n=1 Tax=Streptomyces sp. NPDC059096 TaxID=3346727 RepID=UPI0036C09605